jgi:hypothetical protein
MNPDPTKTNLSTATPRVSPAWIAIACFLVFLFDPGIMSNDSIQTLKQARTLDLTDWHPPIMALVWRVLDWIVAGPAAMLFAQCVLYAFAMARLCAHAFPQLSRRIHPWVLVTCFSLFPPAMALIGVIWKDVWMSGLLLLAMSWLFSLSAMEGGGRRTWLAFGTIVACCLLATAFRHNALAATAGLLAGALYFSWRSPRPRLRLLGACTGGVVLALLLAAVVAVFNSLVAKPLHVTTPLLLHDIAGIIVDSGEPEVAAHLALSTDTRLTDDRSTFLAKVTRAYDPGAAGTLIYTSRNTDTPFVVNVYQDDHDAAGVRATWKTMVRHYPVAYLEHRARSFACLLQLCGMERWISRSYFLNAKYALPATVEKDTWQWHARKALLSPRLAPIYSPLAWLLVTLVGLATGLRILWRPSRTRALLLFMGLSSAGLALSLFFTSPIESYRYIHWCVLLGWTMVIMLVEHLARSRAMSRRIVNVADRLV